MHRKLNLLESNMECGQLRQVGLRPTRQRLNLAHLLFRGGHRHVTAEMLCAEAYSAGLRVSVGTMYNTLREFARAGLLRQIAVDPTRMYYDTNTASHHHFYCEDDKSLSDISASAITVPNMPNLPEGVGISQVDIVVRVRRIRSPQLY